MKTNDITEYYEETGTRLSYTWFVPFAVAVFGLLLYSAYKNIYYKLYDVLDYQVTEPENLPLLLICVLLVLCFLNLWTKYLAPRLPKWVTPVLPLVNCTGISLYLIIAVRGLAVNDGLFMDRITNQFVRGDYTELTEPDGYLYAKSHQIGYLAYEQMMYHLFGESNYRAYQIVNLISILITLYLLQRFAEELFREKRVRQMTALLSCGMLFLFVYTTNIYNDIPSLPFQTAAMYLLLRYLRTRKRSCAVFSGILLAIGYCIKTNVLISLVAMVMVLLADAVRQAKDAHRSSRGAITSLFFAVYLMVLCPLSLNAIRLHYATLTGMETFPKGEPMSTYVAMSLMETDEGQSGWYNGYNSTTFKDNGYDYDKTNAQAYVDIQKRLGELIADPSHGIYFFAKKFLTQWGDASCISMRNLELASRHIEGHSSLVNSIIYGRGMRIFYWIMNVFQTIVLLGCCIYCIDTFRQGRVPSAQSFLLLFIFGGMIFHEFWEASSRYTMRYYIFFVPFAAYGIDRLLQKKRGQT